jgi:hypothetical protein
MEHHDQPDDVAATAAPAALPGLSPQGASRRRIAGLGVSGVLMTVASGSGMADVVCKSPSGALSGDLNSNAPKQTCAGRSPTWWSTHTSLFPKNITKKTRFGDIFPNGGAVGNMTVIKVLEMRGNTGVDGVPALMLAMYLNVNAKPAMIGFLTPQAVKDMWANYVSNNFQYRPGNGSKVWDSAQFAEYLASTQIP